MADSYLLPTLDAEKELPQLLEILSALGEGERTVEELRRRLETRCEDENADQYSLVRRRVLDQAGLNGDDLMRSRAKKSSLRASPQLGHRVLGLVAVMPCRPALGMLHPQRLPIS